MKKKLIRRVLLGLLVGLLLFTGHTLYFAGVFRTIKPHFVGTVKSVKVLGGAEDITIDQARGIAYISADDRRMTVAKTPVKGTIYRVDLKKPGSPPVDMLPNFKKDFHPHGIYRYQGKKGQGFLFVVNHMKQDQDQAHAIERFKIQGKQLIHLETIQHELMTAPNDLVAINERQFYVTNDHGYPKGVGRTIEEYLRLPLGSVNFYDGKSMTRVTSGIRYANGINISKDLKTLFVASPSGHKVLVFNRISNTQLEKVESIGLGTATDNLEFDAEGNLWTGCHPKMLAFVAHSKNKSKLSPSQVLKISYKGKGDYTVEEVYLNDGKPLSGSSAAAVYQDNLLIGGVYDRKFLWCKMKQ